MKKLWKIFALVLAVLLLCTACEQRKVIDISDGGDMIGDAAAAPAAAPAAKPATTAPEKNEEQPAAEEAEKAPVPVTDGDVTVKEMSMRAGGKGMCLVPVNKGGVFVVNSVLSETCTITTDPKDFLSADCTVQAKGRTDAALEFVLLQKDKELLHCKLDASLKEGENSIQVLIRLEGAASGEYVGRLYVNGDFIGECSVTA